MKSLEQLKKMLQDASDTAGQLFYLADEQDEVFTAEGNEAVLNYLTYMANLKIE